MQIYRVDINQQLGYTANEKNDFDMIVCIISHFSFDKIWICCDLNWDMFRII